MCTQAYAMYATTLNENDQEYACDDCGLAFPADMLDDDGLCDACSAFSAAYSAAEESREEAQGEADEAQDELDSAESELADLMDQIKEAKARVTRAKRAVGSTANRLVIAEASLEALAA